MFQLNPSNWTNMKSVYDHFNFFIFSSEILLLALYKHRFNLEW